MLPMMLFDNMLYDILTQHDHKFFNLDKILIFLIKPQR